MSHGSGGLGFGVNGALELVMRLRGLGMALGDACLGAMKHIPFCFL